MNTPFDPHTVARAVLASAQKHFVYGNGLMNVMIFRRLFHSDVSFVQGFLNVNETASVRHFYMELANGETLDPTYFTPKLLEQSLSNSHDALYEHTPTEEESVREFFFAQSNSDGYWMLVNKKCVEVYKDVLKQLNLRFEDYPIPTQKVSVNDACPCGSGKKFKRCHSGVTF